jgi:N-acyl-phosphatidylethanolamine-hydrolysing phospholipase D
VKEMVWWEESELVAGTDDGSKTKIVFTPTNHWSRRTAFDQNKCLWGSWAVVGAKVSHFLSDSTSIGIQTLDI